MGSNLAIYDRVTDLGTFTEKLGTAMARSGTFGLQNEEQGFVMALTCICEGITPLEFHRKYHIILGKPTMRADRMLAEFRSEIGGKHKVLREDSECIEIEFELDGQKRVESLTWEECQQEPWPWKDKDDHKKGLKDNWASPRGRRSMMFCRVISNAIRHMAPEIVAGTYTPEEIEDVVFSSAPVASSNAVYTLADKMSAADEVTEVAAEVVEEPAVSAPDPAAAFIETARELQQEIEAKLEAVSTPGKGTILPATVDRIVEMYETCNIPQRARDNALKVREVQSLSDLTEPQGQEILEKLEMLLTEQKKKLRASSKG